MTRRARLQRSYRKSVRISNRKYRNSSEAAQLFHVQTAAIDRWLFHGRSMEPRSKVCCLVRAAKLQCLTTNFWEVLCIILVLTLLVDSGVSQQSNGFISIDCGGARGTRLNDSFTGLEWRTDEDFLDSEKQLAREGVALSANVTLSSEEGAPRDNAEQLRTAMVFIPGKTSRSKFCYNLNVSRNSKYLLRAMFPSKNLSATTSGTDQEREELNSYGTRFYFTVDSTYILTIELNQSEPQTVELVLNSLDNRMYICLVPLEDKSSMSAISTIELRPLPLALYENSEESNTGDQKASERMTYFMTVSRLNFGGNTSLPAVRYPDDRYDRLWSAVKIPEEESSEIKMSRSLDHVHRDRTWDLDSREIPDKVIESAWEGVNMNSNISFKLNIGAARAYRPLQTFYFQIFFHDVGLRESDNITRFVNISDDDYKRTWGPNTKVPPDNVFWWYWYKRTFSRARNLVTFRITRNKSSMLPAMVNAVDVLGEFEAVTERTTRIDALAITELSKMFPNQEDVDTVGDPCLPVPWSWLVCSIQIPPRITQIVLAGKGGEGPLDEKFGSQKLNRLTILDVSNNSFSGGLPKSLVGIVTLRELNISANNLSGDLPPFGKKLVNLETISLRNNGLTGNVSSLVQALGSTVSTLDLSMNRFNGSIPHEIGGLKNLKILDLSNNRFSTLSRNLFKLPKLQILNLQNNSLHGLVPDGIWLSRNSTKSSRTLQINLGGNNFTELNLTTWFQTVFASDNVNLTYEVILVDNPIETVELPRQDEAITQHCLCGPAKISNSFILLGENNTWCKNLLKHEADMTLTERYLCRSSENPEFCERGDNNNEKLLIISLVVSGVVVLLMACVLVFSLRKMWKRMTDLRQIQEALAKDHVKPPIFNYGDVKAGTRKFSRENELGKGSFGAVYKAELPDQIVAVKVLFKSEQTADDFLNEMVVISGIKHRHLIQLKGCCVRDSKRMLVYEYAENGNLDQALWGDKTSEVVLTWPQRLKICVGVAKGLSYLHEELQPAIIHRDIKPQNILLDKDWNAKIADFGLARPMEEDGSQMATLNIGGTRGYFPPEYATHGWITEKLDVYSYGIVVLEIVSGRRCIHSSPHTDEIYIKNWAFKAYKAGDLTGIAEQSMLATAPADEIESVLKTALLCVQEDPEKRPTMSQVVNMLTGNSSNLAIDIVSELKGQPILYDRLYDSTTFTTQLNATQDKEDLALLGSSSSSVSNGMIELNVSGR